VDDDSDMRLYLRGCLLARNSPAQRVLEAADGEAALRLIRSEEVAPLVSDVLLPTMDGLALRRAIRRDPVHAHLPVLLISGEGGGPSDMDARDGFLPKPFNARQLISAVNRLMVAASDEPFDGARGG
jgi:CheY-like chemotaxis protein